VYLVTYTQKQKFNQKDTDINEIFCHILVNHRDRHSREQFL